jgi:sigma-B regulation protein RsbU (phosphoserine phosphatase)
MVLSPSSRPVARFRRASTRLSPASWETAQLAPGGSLFLFTDGVTEAVNAANEFFGAERLEASLRSCAGHAPEDMVLAVLRQVRAFAGAAAPSDDIAMLGCRWQGG